jgi:V/A-type H+/Na+-transporting ATPase subunit E
MKTIEENFESLSRTIQSDAHTESEKVLAEAKAKADALQQEAQEQANALRESILARASQEAQRLRSQAMATSELKARTLQLKHREMLLDNVFNQVKQQLSTVIQWNDYNQVTLRLLHEALGQLNTTKATIRADEVTQKLFTAEVLAKVSQEMKMTLKLGQPLAHGTGVVVETEDGHLHYDNTLETRLNRIQNQIRLQVYHLLMGETL